MFDRSAVSKVHSNARGPETVAAQTIPDARLPAPPLYHGKGLAPTEAITGKPPSLVEGTKQRCHFVVPDIRCGQVGIEIPLGAPR